MFINLVSYLSCFFLCAVHGFKRCCCCPVTKSCPTLCDPMVCSIPGFPVLHYIPEFAQTHVHWVGDAIQPSHLLLFPFLPAFNLSQHQGLFEWVSSLHQMARVLKLQLQHQSFQVRTTAVKSLQSCLTLCDPIDGSPSDSPRPWDSPGKNTGVGCHFLLQCMKVKSESEVAQSCLTLSNPMDCSLPGFSIHGIFQAGVLEWGAIVFYKLY